LGKELERVYVEECSGTQSRQSYMLDDLVGFSEKWKNIAYLLMLLACSLVIQPGSAGCYN